MTIKTQVLAFILVLFSSFTFFAQSNQWKKTNEKNLSTTEKMQRGNIPHTYQLFEVNLTNLTEKLITAPDDISSDSSSTFVDFPDGNGNISSFEIFTSQMLEPELAAQHPNIHNFTGINRKDPTNVIKISITPAFGMHIMGYDGEGTTYYIDTYTTDFNSYIFYQRNNIENSNNSFRCLVEGNQTAVENVITSGNQILSTDNKFRRYRFAMACTTEYAAFHVNAAPNNVPQATEAQKKDIVIAAMNVTINRLNSIYERDLSLRFVLVNNNRNIVFITSDNFSNDDDFELIHQSQAVITQIIGTANFDIGHTVSTGGGGLASASPCDASSKASGITGSFQPVGDPFDIDYVAHEVGHQFWANHTFNNSCFGNRNDGTAVEPGSGSTIMSYAGICAPNIQNNSDAYFHQRSIQEMSTFLLNPNWNNCPEIISTNNPTPVITSTSGNRTVPLSTPFILTTTATDTNNPNSLTYTWEQMNQQISTQPPVASSTNGPNFRSVAPTSNRSRSFPSTQTVLAGTTNSNGIVSSTWERLPSVARTMNFATTVRDNNATNGGQTKSQQVTITFAANTGPFVITYPNNISNTTEPNWSVGEQKTITWNVAGTNANGVNTANVNILMSQDNGLTYPYTLALNTPNDGSQTITVPALTSANLPARIKIEAVGNIFYTVSKPIGINVTASNSEFEFDNFNLYPNPTSDVVTISFNSTTGNEITMKVFDIRGRVLKSYQIENVGTISNEIDLSNYASGIYLVKIIDGSHQSTKKIIKK